MTIKRAKEIKLRNNLRILRTAIDAFKKDCDGKKLSMVEGFCVADQDNYPETLEQLTQPLKLTGDVDKTRKYLRRIPRDPMTEIESSDNTNNWGLRPTPMTPIQNSGAAGMFTMSIQRARP